jgi:membrane-associated phospholipid phosphatase
MILDTPSWSSYNPGYLNQDLVTLPIEGAAILLLNKSYTPRSDALWPFQGEVATASMKPTTLTSSMMVPIAAGAAGAIFTGLALSNSNFPVWTQARGWLHAILLTEIATSSAKVTFQRKRPFFDTELNQYGTTSDDDRFSFFSGHASHAFSFATYSSLLMFEYSSSPVVNWIYSAAAFAGASAVAYSRVNDHAHNVSDIVVGGIVGTIISASVFYRVHIVDQEHNRQDKSFSWQIVPTITSDEQDRLWYGGNIGIRY